MDAPRAVHHVMVRGIERRILFADDLDRTQFLERLARILSEGGYACYAWALMPNHAHLVVRSAEISISHAMARLGTGYARYFNARHGRVGHLFQNRFRSRLVREDADLLGLIRYVHLNPLVGGVVTTLAALEAHPWSGHAALMGQQAARRFHGVAACLRLFGDTDATARARLHAWMCEGLVGSATSLREPEETSRVPRRESATGEQPVRQRGKPPALHDLVEEMCHRLGVASSDLRAGVRMRQVSRARQLLAHLAVDRFGCLGRDVAPLLGVSRSGVCRAAAEGRRIAPELGRELGPLPSLGGEDSTSQ